MVAFASFVEYFTSYILLQVIRMVAFASFCIKHNLFMSLKIQKKLQGTIVNKIKVLLRKCLCIYYHNSQKYFEKVVPKHSGVPNLFSAHPLNLNIDPYIHFTHKL